VIYTPSPQMQADIRRREGFSLKVYADSKGLATQGYGRHHGVKFGDPDITPAIANLWLSDDLQQGYMDALQVFPNLNTMDAVRRDVCVDLAFNMGLNTLELFVPFIDAVNAGDWPTAHLHLLTNMSRHLTPYLTQVGVRAVDNAGRIATGIVPKEFRVP
jgi:GH24 family phage-related lysozyme (muramidase)